MTFKSSSRRTSITCTFATCPKYTKLHIAMWLCFVKKKKKNLCLRPSIVWKGKMGVYLNPHIWIYDTLSQFSIQLWQSRFETSFWFLSFYWHFLWKIREWCNFHLVRHVEECSLVVSFKLGCLYTSFSHLVSQRPNLPIFIQILFYLWWESWEITCLWD